jgi:predicted dehydrogenase
MSQLMKVAVVGGGIGDAHIRGFQSLPERFEVVAICDIDAAKAQKLADTYHIPHVFTDYSELCSVADVDAIDICTPPYLHYDQIHEALAVDKHIICEKPLVGSLKEVDELIAAETHSGKRIMPIFQYRFGQGLQKLKFLVDSGIAGKAYLTTVETAWLRGVEYFSVPWRGKWQTELGGSLVIHGIHAHDMMCHVLGPVRKVFSRIATLVYPTQLDDCATTVLEMADGSLATWAVTLGSYRQMTRHRFCFSNFTAESNTEPYRNSHEPWTYDVASPEIAQQIEEALKDFKPQPEGFVGQFARFYDALQTGDELPVTLNDARVSIELITAQYHSALTGEQVELPIGNHHPRYTGWSPD